MFPSATIRMLLRWWATPAATPPMASSRSASTEGRGSITGVGGSLHDEEPRRARRASWQAHPHRRAASRCGLHRDPPTVGLERREDEEEAEARPADIGFRRVERLEDPARMLRIHAPAAVWGALLHRVVVPDPGLH